MNKLALSLIAAAVTGVAAAGSLNWTINLNAWNGDGWDSAGLVKATWSATESKWTTSSVTPKVNGNDVTLTTKGGLNKTSFENNTVSVDIENSSDVFYILEFYNGDGGTSLISASGIWYGSTGKNPEKGTLYSGQQIWEAINGAAKKFDFDSIKDSNSNSTHLGTLSIPEPTSGLMLVLGAGMLALRRKRVSRSAV